MVKVKNIYKIVILVSIILSSLAWISFNNSFNLSGDELWYTDYAVHFNDQETEDIRHNTENDLQQIAFLKGYRIIQRNFIKIFGLNIYGLRMINLFFLSLALMSAGILSYKIKIKPFYFILFPLLILSNFKLLRMLFNARPDWTIVSLAIITISIAILFIHTKRESLMYSAILTASLSTVIYWNGLAIVGGLGLLLLSLAVKKIISWKKFLCFSIFFTVTLFCTLGLHILSEKDMTNNLINNDALHVSQVSKGLIFQKYPEYSLTILKNIFSRGKQGLLLGLLTVIAIFLNLTILDKKYSKKIKELSLAFTAFLIGYTTISIFRGPGSGSRAIYMVTPVIFLWLVFSINYALTDLKKYKKPITVLVLSYVVLFIGIHSINSAQLILNNRGAGQEYAKFTEDLQKIIPRDSRRVYTKYIYSLALEGYPKFFQENNHFNPPRTYKEQEKLINEYGIQYIMVDDMTRFYISNPEKNVPKKFGDDFHWYTYLDQVIKKDFSKIGEVYNKRYFSKEHDGSIINKKGFRTDIYKKNE